MSLSRLVLRNLTQTPVRSCLASLGIALAIVGFILLRTVIDAWSAGAQYAAKDRLSTRNRVSYGQPLPKRYAEMIAAQVPGVRSVTFCEWFGGRWAADPSQFFANLACADNAFEVYPEISIEPKTLSRWRHDRQGAIVGDVLARRLGWHIGDRVTLIGSFYPGTWQFTLDGIYTAPPRSAVDRSSFFFRWDYKNARVPEAQRDQIGWIFTRVDDPRRSPEISRAIDALFEDSDLRTSTTSERAANAALLGGVSAVLGAFDLVSIGLLAVVSLLLGNALAMSARQRQREYATLRALGFRPAHVRALIAAEALSLAAIGCGLGCALAFPLVQLGLGGWLERNMGQFFPVFRIAPATLAAAAGAGLVLALVSAFVPALRGGALPVSGALRRVT